MSHIAKAVLDGLTFGFTFALGWFAAALLLGVVLV